MPINTSTQTSFTELEFTSKKRQTRWEKFLWEMEQVVPWTLLLAKLEPHYPQSGRRGRQPMSLNRIFRIYCMQQWFSYSDLARYLQYTKGSRHWGLSWCVNDKRKPGKNLSSSKRKRHRKYSSVRARVEHIFRIIKC